MAYNYVVTAHKPTNVTHSLTGSFTSPEDRNLILIKSTRLEIYTITKEEILAPVLDVKIYGRVNTAQIYRPKQEPQDLLFLSTDRFAFCVLAYDGAKKELVTRARGDLHEGTGRPVEDGDLATVDPDCRMIGLHLYEGLFKILPMEQGGKLMDPFNIRMEESGVVDLKFLHGCTKPTVAVLYRDHREAKHLKTFTINMREKSSSNGWSQSNVDKGASMIIPVPAPLGGVLIVGGETIAYHTGNSFKSIAMQQTQIVAWGQVDHDGTRFLLGDLLGGLHVLVLTTEANGPPRVESVRIQTLGETSLASSISYLDAGVVFIGSSFGDSQVIRLKQDCDQQTGSFVEVLEEHMNLGPIVDMCVVDLDRQGQCQVVTCSGAYKDGSLRVIRNGIGINVQASIDLPGIKGMWSLRASTQAEHDTYLVQSFISETRVLAMEDEEMEEVQIPGFATGKTVFCGNMLGDLIVQVTESSVRLVSCDTRELKQEWPAPSGFKITVGSANLTQVVVAITGGELIYLELSVPQQKLEVKSKVKLEHEISCINLNPLVPKPAAGSMEVVQEDGPVEGSQRSDLVAVGMWTDMTVRLLALPTLQALVKCQLGGDTQARSLMLVTLEAKDYLMVALGDGHLIYFPLTQAGGALPTLGPRKKVSLGTQPIMLTVFRSHGNTCVFATSDRPTVIYSSGSKIMYANVNIGEVTGMCPFNPATFPNCLALANENSLTIGVIEDIQKLQIRSYPLGETPKRIAHYAQGHCFAVLTSKYSLNASGEEEEESTVRFFDDQSFEEVASHKLNVTEMPCSVVACTFGQDPREFLVVGTALANEDDSEPKEGRLLVFSMSGEGRADRELHLMAEKNTKGAVWVMNAFNGKLLTGINNKVQLYRWAEKDGAPELQSECGHHGHVLALYIQSRGDFIIVGDLMRSITLLVYKQLDGTITEIAKDFSPLWTTAVEMFDDDFYLLSDHNGNLVTLKKNADAANDEDRSRLEIQAEFNTSEFINRFRRGSLVMQPVEADSLPSQAMGSLGLPSPPAASTAASNPASTSPQPTSILFGTTNGTLGVIIPITEDDYRLFLSLQRALNEVIHGVGGLDHKSWRSFRDNTRKTEAKNFVDGDLVESFLDLSKKDMEKVIETMKGEGWACNQAGMEDPTSRTGLSVEDVYKRVEDMSRLH